MSPDLHSYTATWALNKRLIASLVIAAVVATPEANSGQKQNPL